MGKNAEVLVIGGAVVDIPLCPVDRNIFQKDVCLLDNITMTAGGDALNEATIISRLGHSVKLMSIVGNDPAGLFIKKHCSNNKIDDTFVKVRDDVNTSINIPIVSSDGERVFITNRSGSVWKFEDSDIVLEAIDQIKVISFASIFINPKISLDTIEKIFSIAHKKGIIVCADMIKSRFGETLNDISRICPYIDYLFINLEEAIHLTKKSKKEDIIKAFLNHSIKNIIIKAGNKGATLANHNTAITSPAYPNSACIDTTGAGDNFAAGFISALLDGRSLEESMRYANVTASISIEQIGATTAVQNRKQVELRLKKYMALSSS